MHFVANITIDKHLTVAKSTQCHYNYFLVKSQDSSHEENSWILLHLKMWKENIV